MYRMTLKAVQYRRSNMQDRFQRYPSLISCGCLEETTILHTLAIPREPHHLQADATHLLEAFHVRTRRMVTAVLSRAALPCPCRVEALSEQAPVFSNTFHADSLLSHNQKPRDFPTYVPRAEEVWERHRRAGR